MGPTTPSFLIPRAALALVVELVELTGDCRGKFWWHVGHEVQLSAPAAVTATLGCLPEMKLWPKAICTMMTPSE